MAQQPTLTAEEKWLEKFFGVDVTALKGEYEPDGSKKRDKWLLRLKMFKNTFEKYETRVTAALKVKIPNDDNEGQDALEAVKKKFTYIKGMVKKNRSMYAADDEIEDESEPVFDTFNEYLTSRKIKNV